MGILEGAEEFRDSRPAAYGGHGTEEYMKSRRELKLGLPRTDCVLQVTCRTIMVPYANF